LWCVEKSWKNIKTIKAALPKQILEDLQVCQVRIINIITNEEIRMPNCTETVWTTENIKTKEIKITLTNITTIAYHLDFLKK
jgi:hypothetical protein